MSEHEDSEKGEKNSDEVVSIPVVAHDTTKDDSDDHSGNSEELGAVENRILEPQVQGDTTDLFVKQGFHYAFKRSLKSPYFLSNLVYVIYTSLIISIDVNQNNFTTEYINTLYLVASCVHLINGTMYIWVWYHEGFRFPLFGVLIIPELLNMIEASMYISTASQYPLESQYTLGGNYTYINDTLEGNYTLIYDTEITVHIQNVELAASIIDWMASFGWVITWYLTYRRTLGRGWTLDDPDVWANLTIWAGTLNYVAYNIQIVSDRSQYGTNNVYVIADWIFFVNSIVYIICAMRDAGWFYFMPTAGVRKFTDQYTVVKKEKVK